MPRIREWAQPPQQVFALSTPAHMLQKLCWEIGQLKHSLEPDEHYRISGDAVYHAFNCAITSWHISDWIWEIFSPAEREDLIRRFGASFDVASKDALIKFQDLLRAKHRSLHICWQIANGSKHRNIRKPDPLIAVEEIRINQSQTGLMRAGQPLGWHKQHLIVHDGGRKLAALEVFGEAADRWEDELRAVGLLEDRYVCGD